MKAGWLSNSELIKLLRTLNKAASLARKRAAAHAKQTSIYCHDHGFANGIKYAIVQIKKRAYRPE